MTTTSLTNRSCFSGAAPRRAFTLVELAVVIALLAVLAVTALPALCRAKPKSQTARCATNMRLWGMATAMYLGDNSDHLPYYAHAFGEVQSGVYWYATLGPYVAKVCQTGPAFDAQLGSYPPIATNDIMRCPAGSYGAPPFSTAPFSPTAWNCWVGVNFGTYSTSLNGPFYYATSGTTTYPPLSVSRIRKPADALTFMDTDAHYLYSPVLRPFTSDADGDGVPDSDPNYTPYNHARPTVHDNGANVTLMDGHVEWVAFKKLWALSGPSKVAHSFWYMED
jgi:prepilin-type N-terminal cleavage/methylation domain-containing protein/prepilin-type processing-associated H-X9-DG protein